MRYGSCFAGVGGFDLALERAGWECAWQIEKDGPCRKVLERHFPGVPQFGDIREVTGEQLGPVDLVCGGWPCQDLSVAGRRAGLAGSRSELFWELHRLVGELRPRWLLLENVPGLLSSHEGRDMGAVLGSLGGLGYGYAYRVLDAQHFGVPQRRRRVFVVGCLGDGAAAAQVLLESESGAGDLEAGDQARPDLAGTLGGGSGERGWPADVERMTFGPEISPAISGPNDPQAEDQAAYVARQVDGSEVASTLRGFGHGWQGQHNDTNAVVARPLNGKLNRNEEDVDTLIASPVTASAGHHGHSSPRGDGSDNLVAGTLAPGAHPGGLTGREAESGVLAVALGVHANQRGEARTSGLAGSLSSQPSGKQFEGVMETISSNPRNRSGSPGPVVVATGLHLTQDPITAEEMAPALGESSYMGVAYQVHGETSNGSGAVETDTARALDQQGFSGGRGGTAVAQGATVRRLTPTECERLQGFPDSRVYAMAGNAVCVNVVQWIARRIPA